MTDRNFTKQVKFVIEQRKHNLGHTHYSRRVEERTGEKGVGEGAGMGSGEGCRRGSGNGIGGRVKWVRGIG